MKAHHSNITERIIKKAAKGSCHYKIVAVGIDFRGNIISIRANRHRFTRKGGGIHAEQIVMRTSPKSLARVLIARVNRGRFMPIHPCEKCVRMAEKMNVKIEALG